MTPPTTLVLAAPDWHALDTLARRADPPVLWPVGTQSLAAHWLDHAVRLGCKEVVLYNPDRPSDVRAALEGGAYWSVKLDLRPSSPPEGKTVEIIDHLPGRPALATAPSNGAALVRWWLDLNLDWLAARDPALVHVDTQREPGGWIGPRAIIPDDVVLRPPYWIGAGTLVGHGCTIGPGALVGPGSVLSDDVHLANALVLGGTFVGEHLDLHGKLLLGATLLDPTKPARADLTDDFIAAAMRRPAQVTPLIDRLLALALWLPARLLALAAGPVAEITITLPGGARFTIRTGTRGYLLARRARWLDAVIAGRLRLVGILPRAQSTVPMPDETRALLAHTTPGVFSLADVHGSHSPDEPDELAHALYQTALPEADSIVRRALWKLIFARPSP